MFRKILMISLCLFLICFNTSYAQHITSPKEFFGFDIGDDYQLANYSQTEEYFKTITRQSDRAIIQDIGKTEEGRTQYMMIVSSPQNLKQLKEYKEISQKLARAEIPESEAMPLIKKGKAVVWIDGGLHATETVGAQQLIELYYQLLSHNDDATRNILDNVIILLSEVNPDGMELVSNWYMQEKDPAQRNMMIPKVYNKYVGHDNNRDFYMINMSETRNITRIQYLEWMPQIIYNHHQSGPAGSVLAGPPYRPPFNYKYDPLVMTGVDGVGSSMINQLNAEGKPGYTRMGGSQFNTWWNGGLRTAPYYHNMIGLLTEIIGNPTPSSVPLVPDRLLADNNTPFPVFPQTWHFRKSIDYSVSLNYGVLDYAARMRENMLRNIYVMGRNSIQKGSEDTWTVQPHKIDSLKAIFARDQKSGKVKAVEGGSFFSRETLPPSNYFDSVFKSPEYKDPRGFIIPSDQPDFPTAVDFVNALIKSGMRIEKATADFTVNNKKYPKGSYIVKTDQAFRPHIIDMFEPQNYPNDFQYPGGPPVRPYDQAGWTLAFQMGVQFDRIMDGFDGPFTTIPYGELQKPEAQSIGSGKGGYVLSPEVNNSFIAVNDLLNAGVQVFRVGRSESGVAAGAFYVPANGSKILDASAKSLGITVAAAGKRPASLSPISKAKIALYDQYGGNIPSGWVRWILEQYHFDYDVIYPQEIDGGNMNKKYDMILFVDVNVPGGEASFFSSRQPRPDQIPDKYRSWLGSITVNKTIPQLKTFLNNGGHVVAIGSSSRLAYLLGLPVENALTQMNSAGKLVPVSSNDYYIPGSILRAELDNSQPENWGMGEAADMVFSNSPVFTMQPNAVKAGLKPLAWFSTEPPLRSGWAWGQSYLQNGIVAFSAPYGKGSFYACSTEITFRGQAHGTYKMFFNQLYMAK